MVFDQGLQKSRLGDTSLLEQGYRLLSSNWQRRMWTLQEAVLAQKLTFRFSDDLMHFESLLPLLESSDKPEALPSDPAIMELRRALDYFCTGNYKSDPLSTRTVIHTACVDRLISTITHFSHRTATRLTDEPICLATLLNFDLTEILKVPEADGFRRILAHQKAFAPNVIFLNGPKMQDEPYRWAPKSFLYPSNFMHRAQFTPVPIMTSTSATSGTMRFATVTPGGLLLDLPGILIFRPARGTTVSGEGGGQSLCGEHNELQPATAPVHLDGAGEWQRLRRATADCRTFQQRGNAVGGGGDGIRGLAIHRHPCHPTCGAAERRDGWLCSSAPSEYFGAARLKYRTGRNDCQRPGRPSAHWTMRDAR